MSASNGANSKNRSRSLQRDASAASEEVTSSPAGKTSSVLAPAPVAPQKEVKSSRVDVPLAILLPLSAPPLLSKRQMQDLLRGNRNTHITVMIENEPVCAVLRPIAKHFSPAWRRESFANKDCDAVNIAMPAPATTNDGRRYFCGNAVMFIVQWMERGGAHPVGKHAQLYPSGNPEELKRLRSLVTALEISPLIARTDRDLATIRRPKFSTLRKTTGYVDISGRHVFSAPIAKEDPIQEMTVRG